MLLQNKVQVNERFQRSIRIDTDIGDESVISSYICPQSSAEVLLSMARGRNQAGEAAFTWTGPYGSGKSSLVVILNALLGEDTKLRSKAVKSIGEKNAEKILHAFGVTARKSWTFVPFVGSKGNVTESLIDALKTYTGTRKKITADNLLNVVSELANEEACGLCIVIDEMGKFLEAAADGESDIYLFQQLAEIATRSKGKIVLLGVLHQAFAEYARRLSRNVRDEWSKIQGRFVDLPLNVAGEELIDLIGRAIKSNAKPIKSTKAAKLTADHISERRPVHAANLAASLTQCWPLHPVTASLLGPISRRRFGQNQRSVFGFLNSAEPYGFQEFLKSTEFKDDAYYTPAVLWDYLRSNLEPSIIASPDGHKWSLAVDALFRIEAVTNDRHTIDILKCIAIIDLFQERSGLVPDYNLLAVCLPHLSEAEIKKTLSRLSDQAIIRFKKHKNAYSLYEGSDFDIEAAAEEAYEQAPALDFDRIRKAAHFQPIVAKKHYHETGALRWFDVDLVPAEQALKMASSYQPSNGAVGLIMIVLGDSENQNDNSLEKLCKQVSTVNKEWPVFVSLAQNSWVIRSYAKELQSLEWIRNNNPALGGDTVARREVETRLADVKDKLEEQLSSTLQDGKWFIEGRQPVSYTFKELHSLASIKADEIYSESPKINSELINRIKPSSNSMAALKELLKAMTQNTGQPRLGIEGYPAEGGLYETLIGNTGLYNQSKNGLQFGVPSAKNDSCRLSSLWEAADSFFKANQNRAVPLTDLYDIWAARPFGLKDGLHPFFAMAYLLTRRQSYAVYFEGVYRPDLDGLLIDYILKSPGDIFLRPTNFTVAGKKILAGVVQTLNKISPAYQLSDNSEPLEIARTLVASVVGLAPWVLRTRQLSSNAIKLRELIKNANDPNKVLFDDLPKLFNEHESSLSKGNVQPIIDEFSSNLNELSVAYPNLLKTLRKQLAEELEIDAKGALGYQEINMRARNIMQISGDFKLDAFAARLSTYKGTDADIEGIASLAADKPARDWIDLDVNRVKLKLAELSRQFNHVEAYGRVQNREDYRQAVAFMVGLNGKPRTFTHEFTVKQTQQKAVQEIETKLSKLLFDHKLDANLLLAALANVGARILEQEEAGSKPKKAATA